jgi:broad specificity phosphatase PhoE
MCTDATHTRTRLLLVRHGATVLSADDRFAGSTDVPLGDDGRTQAQHLARRLAREAIAAAYCSSMRRAIETATIVADPHGLAVRPLSGLREVDHGRWEGLLRADVEALYPDEYAAWERDPLHAAPTAGETGEAVLARALTTLRGIVQAHAGQQVLIVSHKATIRLLAAHVLGFDPRAYRDRLDQRPACLNVVDFDQAGGARLMLFNDVSHYANEPCQVPAGSHS